MVDSVGIPFAYYQFPEGTDQSTPFICYYFTTSDDLIADNTNYTEIRQLVIELYTDEPDFELESEVESAINDIELVYIKNSAYIDSEKMWQISYTTEVVLNAE
jgi:hypothetical protein